MIKASQNKPVVNTTKCGENMGWVDELDSNDEKVKEVNVSG